jgi:cysteinyl-tRNA synthetase
MEQEILGLPFDIHTGGIDLKFPHHEDEIAQSLAGYGVEPTNYWCHNEFLEVEGVKMSKSAGNFYTLRDLEKQDISPIDVRYAMLSAHYRTKYNFTFNGITAAKKARLRMQDYINDIMNSLNISDMDSFFADNKVIKSEKILELQKSIYSELANDLHTPKALAVLFTFINNNNINLLGNDEKEDFLIMMSELNMIFCS